MTLMTREVTRPASVPGAGETVALRSPGTEIRETELDQTLIRHVSTIATPGTAGESRVALLGLLMAQLAEVDIEIVCRLLDVKRPRLERLVHGTDAIPGSVESRWSLVADVLTRVRLILEESFLQSWLTTPAPDLAGKTPLACLTGNARDREAVQTLARRLSEPSFT